MAPFWSTAPILDGILPLMEDRAPAAVMSLTYRTLRRRCAEAGVSLEGQQSVVPPRTVLEAGRDVALGSKGRRGVMPAMTDFEIAALTASLWRRQGFEASLMWRPPQGKEEASALKMQVGVTLPGAGVLETMARKEAEAVSPREQGWKPLGDVEAWGVYQTRLAALELMAEQRMNALKWSEQAVKMAPDIPLVVFTHVLVLEHNDQPREAAKALVELMQSVPDVPLLQMTFVRLLRKMGNARAASNVLNALSLQGDIDLEWVAEIARVMIKEGQGREALSAFEIVHKKDPQRWEVIFDAALVALALKDPMALERWVKRGQRVAPSSPLWDRLNAAGRGEEPWHESLTGRGGELGVAELGGGRGEDAPGASSPLPPPSPP